MSDYSEAIWTLNSAPRSKPEVAKVSSSAALLLPSFGAVVFAVTLLQVLFLAQGAQGLFRDSDTGWHVRNGEAILTTAAVPQADPFSYTRDGRQWLAWEWLSDAVLGGAHRIAGLSGVALLAAVAIALTAWGAARLSLSLGGNLFFTAAAMVLLLGTTSIHWLARPHVFSWLFALLFLSIAEHERRAGTVRVFYGLPLLACLWANVHASFLLGPAILFIYAIGEWSVAAVYDRRQFRRPGIAGGHRPPLQKNAGFRFAAACLASLLATFVNPYGWQLHQHVFAYLQNDYLMDHISEFRSFSFHSAGALYVELFLLVAVLGAVALVRQRAFGPALLALAMLHLSLYSARHLPTAAVLLLPLCVAALTREAEGWPRLRSLLDYSKRLRAIDRKVLGIVPIVLVFAATVAGLGTLAHAGRVGFDSAKFPVRAVDFLEQRDPGAHVFAKDQWGGYLIYRFAGRSKVFIDGRSDFYEQDFLETYAQVVEVKPGWDAVLKRFDVRFVLVPPDNALASALQLSSDWKRVHADSVAAVFERVS
ncbi:MAG TPA: hypothetical protein VGQ71_14575 [Terriglobales bacterium]|jgi:hypothetical protein|nr:hypothetical protein [Terriglobales bacterium]